jgi:DnaJ-domain-containing protein 1
MTFAPPAFLQNMGTMEWIFILVLLYVLFRRGGARKIGRKVGNVVSQGGAAPAKRGGGGSLSDCYKILEVPESASAEQVRESYKNLVKVWHPDRFPHDEKLREKADEKLKAINVAYEKVMQKYS